MESTEFQEFQESEEGGGGGLDTGTFNRRFAMLSLNNGGSISTIKRRSPSSLSLQEPPTTKKQRPLPLQSSSTTADASDYLRRGFIKLPLPAISPVVSPPYPTSIPFLRQCVSDTIYSPEINNLGVLSNRQSPEDFKISGSPIIQPNLRRSLSDPIHPPPSSTEVGLNSIKEESPISERLKRMKERMRDMSQWWNEILNEDEEEDSGLEDNTNISPKEESKISETEEAVPVSVEKTGECLIIHFKCPCTKAYQILLSGNNCYYKLV